MRYHNVSIDPKYYYNIDFSIEWGVFAFQVMAFGLTNAPTTFQRLMSHASKKYLRDFLEVSMDDLCIHSRKVTTH